MTGASIVAVAITQLAAGRYSAAGTASRQRQRRWADIIKMKCNTYAHSTLYLNVIDLMHDQQVITGCSLFLKRREKQLPCILKHTCRRHLLSLHQ